MTTKNGAPAKEPAYIIDLDELIEPMGRFKLGGKWYDYPHWDSFSLLAQAKQKRLYDRIIRIAVADLDRPEPTEDNPDPIAVDEATSDEYARDVRELVTMISTMPTEAAAEQSPEWLWQAIQGFFTRRTGDIQRVTLRVQRKALEVRTAEESTTESSSPDSAATTKPATTRSRSG